MADITKTSDVLRFESLFVDGDTRTFTLKNPKANIAASQFTSLDSFIRDNNLLIGDKWGGNFGRIVEVKKITTVTKTLDMET